MGYTHYWTSPVKNNISQNWEPFLAEVKVLLNNPRVPLVGWDSEDLSSLPTINYKMVSFNGAGDDGHETFEFVCNPNNPAYRHDPKTFTFCKTAQKPYDLYVCAVLLLAVKHFGADVEVTSNGDVEDWMPAYRLLQELGLESPTPQQILNEEDNEEECSECGLKDIRFELREGVGKQLIQVFYCGNCGHNEEEN